MITIRSADTVDGGPIAAIYNHFIETSIITFEEEAVSAEEISARITQTYSENLPYLVAEDNGCVKGYAYASKWKGRCAYRYTVEVTVYLDPTAIGKGIGSRLYEALFERLAAQNYHMAIAGISLPNEGSIALHEKFGMEKVAHFKEVGYKFNRWVDVGYWQGLIKN